MSKPESGQCNNCYFKGQCRTHGKCDGYTPILQELEELQLIQERERGRAEYYYAWLTYTAEN